MKMHNILALTLVLISCTNKNSESITGEKKIQNIEKKELLNSSLSSSFSPKPTPNLKPEQINFIPLAPALKIVSEVIIKTLDSGLNATSEVLKTCVADSTPTYLFLDCDTFPHIVSSYKDNTGNTYLLITEDGASVENRWVFKIVGEQIENVTTKVWPLFDHKVLANLYKNAGFTNPHYTEDGLRALAHSSYRLLHPRNGESEIQMMEAYPEVDEAKAFAKIRWNGERFELKSEKNK